MQIFFSWQWNLVLENINLEWTGMWLGLLFRWWPQKRNGYKFWTWLTGIGIQKTIQNQGNLFLKPCIRANGWIFLFSLISYLIALAILLVLLARDWSSARSWFKIVCKWLGQSFVLQFPSGNADGKAKMGLGIDVLSSAVQEELAGRWPLLHNYVDNATVTKREKDRDIHTLSPA